MLVKSRLDVYFMHGNEGYEIDVKVIYSVQMCMNLCLYTYPCTIVIKKHTVRNNVSDC